MDHARQLSGIATRERSLLFNQLSLRKLLRCRPQSHPRRACTSFIHTHSDQALQHADRCQTCDHKWITHSVKPDALANFHFELIRGSCSESSCGGFFNVSEILDYPIYILGENRLRSIGGITLPVCAVSVGTTISVFQTTARRPVGHHHLAPPEHLLYLFLRAYMLVPLITPGR
jgi:hypothetical protein